MLRGAITLLCAVQARSVIVLNVTTPEDVPSCARYWAALQTASACAKCPATGDHPCSYRAALEQVNEGTEDDHFMIKLQAKTYSFDTASPPQLSQKYGDKTKSVSIVGQPAGDDDAMYAIEASSGESSSNGTVLDGSGKWQLLCTLIHINVTVSDVTFVNGSARPDQTPKGSGPQDGGAVSNGGSMVMKRCSFHANNATGQGGAIQNTGALELEDVEFIDNEAKSGGAISSAGSSTEPASLKMKRATFTHNTAQQSGGALNCGPGSARLEQVQFMGHAALASGGTGGTINNGGNSLMTLNDSSVTGSIASSGGLVTNDDFAAFKAYNTNFSHGNTTGTSDAHMGGAVQVRGNAEFHGCRFWENLVYMGPKSYSQGSTLALLGKVNSSALFVNSSVDADRTRRHPPEQGGVPGGVPAEFFVQNAGAVLNLTFVNVTNCHDNLIRVDSDHVDHKVAVQTSNHEAARASSHRLSLRYRRPCLAAGNHPWFLGVRRWDVRRYEDDRL